MGWGGVVGGAQQASRRARVLPRGASAAPRRAGASCARCRKPRRSAASRAARTLLTHRRRHLLVWPWPKRFHSQPSRKGGASREGGSGDDDATRRPPLTAPLPRAVEPLRRGLLLVGGERQRSGEPTYAIESAARRTQWDAPARAVRRSCRPATTQSACGIHRLNSAKKGYTPGVVMLSAPSRPSLWWETRGCHEYVINIVLSST